MGKVKFNSRRAYRTLATLGGYSGVVIITALFIAFVISLLFSSLYDFSKGVLAHFGWDNFVIYILLIALLLTSLIIIIIFLKKRIIDSASEQPPEVDIEISRPTKVLILFLSRPNPKNLCSKEYDITRSNFQKKLQIFIDEKGNFLDDGCLEEYGRMNWRMSLQAIKYHLEIKGSSLERVVVIPSADWGGEDELGGTHLLSKTFSNFIEKKAKEKGYHIRVDRIADVVSPKLEIGKGSKRREIDLVKGIKFNDFEALIHLLFSTYSALKKQKYHENEILIDITGGQASSSIAGAVFAILVPTRRFQYIDTNTFEVKSFDVYHELDTILQ